jgi:hypothetical protein
MWFRLLADPAVPGIMPETVITYLSDMTLSAAALRPAPGRPAGRPEVTGLTSLDHSVWFHNPPDLSGWLLFAKISPAAGALRGLTAGQIFGRDGTLIASVAQEALTHGPAAALPGPRCPAAGYASCATASASSVTEASRASMSGTWCTVMSSSAFVLPANSDR